MEESNVLLDLRNISKTFPGVKALSDVSFSINKGEVMALMGENGAGKSTLIKIITGYYHQDPGEGKMILDGEEISPNNTFEAQKLGISTIFQELNLIPQLSIAENIYLGNAPRKNGVIDWQTMNINATRAMSDLGIEIDVTEELQMQSTAIQQMTAIARALSIDTKLLIMDEATSSLASNEIEVLFDIIRKIKAQGISIIFITHKLDEVFEIADRCTILRDGELVTSKPISELSKYTLVSLMIGREASEIVNKRKQYDKRMAERKVLFSAQNIRTSNRRLNGINVELYKGEVLGLAGLLGSGRTELAKVIFGDDQNYSGEMYLNNMAIKFKDPVDAINHHFAFCPEDRRVEGIFPEMSVQDNLTMPQLKKIGRLGFINKRKQKVITEEYISKINIKTPSAEAKIKNLSGGNQQKVILSRWIANKPDLIILDEPTRGIDVGAKGEIEDIISSLADQGISIIYISSELDELVRSCDRIVILKEGKNIKELVAEQISSERIMQEMAGQ